MSNIVRSCIIHLRHGIIDQSCTDDNGQQGTHQELPDLEVPPNAEPIVRDDLADGHPFVVCADRSGFAVGEARAGRAELAPGGPCVVGVGAPALPGIVRDFMVVPKKRLFRYTARRENERQVDVPDCDPRVALVRAERSRIAAVECDAAPILG